MNQNAVIEQLTNNRRLVAIWPRTLRELDEMIVNRTRGVIWPPTQAMIADEEPVLLDIRVPGTENRVVLRAKGRFTIPERHGPMFVVHKEDLLQFAALLRAIENSLPNVRAFPRYPASIDAKITVVMADAETEYASTMTGRVLDLSAAGARVELDGELPPGAEVIMEMDPAQAQMLPASLTGVVLGGRKGGVAVHFAGPNFEAWRQVRYTLRRAAETGIAPSLGSM